MGPQRYATAICTQARRDCFHAPNREEGREPQPRPTALLGAAQNPWGDGAQGHSPGTTSSTVLLLSVKMDGSQQLAKLSFLKNLKRTVTQAAYGDVVSDPLGCVLWQDQHNICCKLRSP